MVPTAWEENNKNEVDKETVGAGLGTVPVNETRRLAPFVPFTVRVPENVPGDDPAGGTKVTE